MASRDLSSNKPTGTYWYQPNFLCVRRSHLSVFLFSMLMLRFTFKFSSCTKTMPLIQRCCVDTEIMDQKYNYCYMLFVYFLAIIMTKCCKMFHGKENRCCNVRIYFTSQWLQRQWTAVAVALFSPARLCQSVPAFTKLPLCTMCQSVSAQTFTPLNKIKVKFTRAS